MNWRWIFLALIPPVLGLALAAAALPAEQAKGESRPDFSGRWKLNREKSDDPRAKRQEAMGSRPPGGMGGPGMGGPMGGGSRGGPGMGGGPPGGGPGPGGGSRPDPEALKQREAALAELEIEHREPELTIADANAQRRFLYTDGRESRRDGDNGQSLEVRTRWKDARVVVESQGGRGKVTETYRLAAEGRELIVETRMEGQGPGGAFSFKRVYDLVTDQPAPAGPPAPTPQR